MIKYVIYDNATGRIITWGEATSASVDGIAEVAGQTVLIVSELATCDTHYVDNGSLVAKTTKPSQYHVFNYTSKQWEADTARCLVLLRRERDGLLARCDWTQITDNQLSDSKKTEWATYRQQLRDLPSSYSNLSNLADVTWPTTPE